MLSNYSLCQQLQPESGLLAVTTMGLLLANQGRVPIAHIIEFKENLRVLLISALFIVLSARLELADLFGQPLGNWLFVLALILLVRPVAVFTSLAGSQLPWRERIFLAWLAPRGIVAAAVSAVFALGLEASGIAGAEGLAALVFLVILATVCLYGLTARPLARLLGLAETDPQGAWILGASPFARALADALRDLDIPTVLIDSNRERIAAARLAGHRAQAANILSERLEESIELGGIGRLLALLPNDEVNSLACLRLVPAFGRAEVYQLDAPSSAQKASTSRDWRGRTLFAEGASSQALEARIASGAVVRRTPLSETFDFAAWRRRYGPDALVLARLRENGKLEWNTTESELEAAPGDILIGLTDPQPLDEQPAAKPSEGDDAPGEE